MCSWPHHYQKQPLKSQRCAVRIGQVVVNVHQFRARPLSGSDIGDSRAGGPPRRHTRPQGQHQGQPMVCAIFDRGSAVFDASRHLLPGAARWQYSNFCILTDRESISSAQWIDHQQSCRLEMPPIVRRTREWARGNLTLTQPGGHLRRPPPERPLEADLSAQFSADIRESRGRLTYPASGSVRTRIVCQRQIGVWIARITRLLTSAPARSRLLRSPLPVLPVANLGSERTGPF